MFSLVTISSLLDGKYVGHTIPEALQIVKQILKTGEKSERMNHYIHRIHRKPKHASLVSSTVTGAAVTVEKAFSPPSVPLHYLLQCTGCPKWCLHHTRSLNSLDTLEWPWWFMFCCSLSFVVDSMKYQMFECLVPGSKVNCKRWGVKMVETNVCLHNGLENEYMDYADIKIVKECYMKTMDPK